MRLINGDALMTWFDNHYDDEEVTVGFISGLIKEQPTIEPKKGKWIDMGDFEQCSVCLGTRLKEVQTFYGKAIWLKTDYCPHCGARMSE